MINLDKFPHVWIDENLFSNPAFTLITNGKLGTTLLYNVSNMQNFTYWQPPLYILLISVSFKLFGLGVTQGRMVSVILGLISIVFTYLLGKELYNKKVGLIASTLLVFNFLFFYVAREIRMDVAVVCFTLIAVFLMILALKKSSLLYYFLSGVVAMMSFLSHPNGLIGIITIYILIFVYKYSSYNLTLFNGIISFFKEKGVYLYSLGLILTSLPYIWYISLDYSSFKEQFMGNIGHSVFSPVNNILNEPSRYISFLNSSTFNNLMAGNHLFLIVIIVVIILTLFLTLIGVIYGLKEKKIQNKLLLTIFFSNIILLMLLVSNKSAVQYLSILLPYWLILIAAIFYPINFKNTFKNFFHRKYLKSSFLISFLTFFIIFNFGAVTYSIYSNVNYDYYDVEVEVSNYIPPGSSVVGDGNYYLALSKSYNYNEYPILMILKPDYVLFNNFNKDNLTLENKTFLIKNYKEIGIIPGNKNIYNSPIIIYKKI